MHGKHPFFCSNIILMIDDKSSQNSYVCIIKVLRRELRFAMTRQIEAEELMQEEIDLDGDENIVAEAEQLHAAATLDVRTLSMKLVLADKAFALVRNQMQKLVETIESLLSQVESGDDSADDASDSSMRSDGDLCDDDSNVSNESHDRQRLVHRAKRAELSAELACREALLAKQEAAKIKSDKQREIDYLKVRCVGCGCHEAYIIVSNYPLLLS